MGTPHCGEPKMRPRVLGSKLYETGFRIEGVAWIGKAGRDRKALNGASGAAIMDLSGKRLSILFY